MCRGVLLAVVVTLWGYPAQANYVEHVHSSGRYDRSPASLHREAMRWDRAGVQLVTWTEVDAAARTRALRVAGWGVAVPPASDVGISWRRRSFQVIAAGRRRLADYITPYAAAVVLQAERRRLIVVVAHLPAHVQDGHHFRANSRAVEWRAAVRQLHTYARDLRRRYSPAVLLIAADWNVDLRLPVWRDRLAAIFPRMALTWVPPFPLGGTHAGGRLIDATLTGATGRARLLPDDASSDHRPYTERLTW